MVVVLDVGEGRGEFLCVVVDYVSLYGCQLTCVAAVVLMVRLFGMGGREANFSSFVTLCNVGSEAFSFDHFSYFDYGPADFMHKIIEIFLLRSTISSQEQKLKEISRLHLGMDDIIRELELATTQIKYDTLARHGKEACELVKHFGPGLMAPWLLVAPKSGSECK